MTSVHLPVREIEVCYSPAMIPAYSPEGKLAVVIDIFRASSAICTAISHGVKEIIPVAELEEAIEYQKKGYVVAAERHGEVVEGFPFGNSPFSFMQPTLRGQSVVLTTTNCTQALHQVKKASSIVLGAFVNYSVLVEYLRSREENILLICAGWKNRFNLEDSFFAGALVHALKDDVRADCDAALAAMRMFEQGKDDFNSWLISASHSKRLRHLPLVKDIEYSLTIDAAPVVPVFDGTRITQEGHASSNSRRSQAHLAR